MYPNLSSDKKNKIDITLLMTAHNEGRLAHRSTKSAMRSIDYAAKHGVAVEFLVVIDAPTPSTEQYFRKYDNIINVYKTEFKDTSQARNFGVEKSSGDYIAILDADDLFSETWLFYAYEFVKNQHNENIILHPRYSIYFDNDNHIFEHINSTDPNFSPTDLILQNYWTALSFGSKSLFQKVPYQPIRRDEGFGYEDWHWNCETIAQGISHLTVDYTCHFIRVRNSLSRSLEHSRHKTVIMPSLLFNRDHVSYYNNKNIANNSYNNDNSRIILKDKNDRFILRNIKCIYRNTIKKFIKNPERISLFIRLTGLSTKVLSGKLSLESVKDSINNFALNELSIPEWLRDEWLQINKIEPLINITYDLHKTRMDTISFPLINYIYNSLLFKWPINTTHVFLLPWLKCGGSDIEALHYINTLASNNLANNILCILTEENQQSPWVSKLPINVSVIYFGDETKGLSIENKKIILTRLIIQENPSVIHNLNSSLAYEIFRDYGRAIISNSTKIFNSVFCTEYLKDGSQVGYAVEDLDQCYDVISYIFSDSQWFADYLIDIYSFDKSKLIAHYMPIDNNSIFHEPTVYIKSEDAKFHILWASRMDWQKRPDILLKIAKQCEHLSVQFHVYGGSLIPLDKEMLNQFEKAINITYCGEYDGFSSLPTDRMHIFLYTSIWDGLPNVLLEACMAGLPCIAPPIGGIPELLSNEAGFLVKHPEDIEGYVEWIMKIMDKPEIAYNAIKIAQKIITDRHNPAMFLKTIRNVPGYCITEDNS